MVFGGEKTFVFVFVLKELPIQLYPIVLYVAYAELPKMTVKLST